MWLKTPDGGAVHVFVGMFQGIISEIEVSRRGADAEAAFRLESRQAGRD